MSGKSVYSFGEDSPLKFEIPDKLAERYNSAADEWFKAQTRFNQKFGRKWDPVKDPIEIRWSKKQRDAWNQFSTIFKRVAEKDGPFHANDIMDDFLIKNAGSVASVSSRSGEMLIGIAIACGVLYGLLNDRNARI